MSNNGLPVTDVVGVSVTLGQRRTAGASAGDAYAQAAQGSAISAANSAAKASQAEQGAVAATDGINEKAEQVAIDADRAETAAENAQNIADANTYYITETDPDGTIAGLAGTPVGKFFRVAQGAGNGFKYYLNDNGVAKEVSETVGAAAVNAALEAANEAGSQAKSTDTRTTSVQVGFANDLDGRAIMNAFTDGEGRINIYDNEDGDVGIGDFKFQKLPPNADYDIAYLDENYIPLFGVSTLGGFRYGNFEVIEIPGPPGLVFLDEDFKPVACLPGFENDQDIPVIGQAVDEALPEFLWPDYVGIKAGGQSLGSGVTKAVDAKVYSTTQPFANRTFSDGLYSDTTGTDTISPLVEKIIGVAGETLWQSEGCLSTLSNDMITRLCNERGTTYDKLGITFLTSSSSAPGFNIAKLQKGTDAYQKGINHITNGMRLALSENKTYAFLFRPWWQGETDILLETPRDEFTKLTRQCITDESADAQQITGQQVAPITLCHQLASHNAYARKYPFMALALRDLANEGLMHIALPGYVSRYSDGVHYLPTSYMMGGKYMERLASRIVKDLQAGREVKKHWLRPVSELRQKNVSITRYECPTYPIRFKTDFVMPTDNFGFDVRNKFTYELYDIITSVEIVGIDRVRIVCSRDLTDADIITYGWGRFDPADPENPQHPQRSGRINGPRGNLCDSDGELNNSGYTDQDGFFIPMDNYCEIFSTESL